jgi:hypothetical protein
MELTGFVTGFVTRFHWDGSVCTGRYAGSLPTLKERV